MPFTLCPHIFDYWKTFMEVFVQGMGTFGHCLKLQPSQARDKMHKP